MGRSQTIKVAALNIKTHPHSYGNYIRLFQKLSQKKIPIVLRGDQIGIVWNASPNSLNSKTIITGVIYRFTKIDPQGYWFNTLKDSEASPEEISQIRIPPNLKHNLNKFRYVFLPEHHYLVYENLYYDSNLKRGVTLSPYSTQKLFQNTFINLEEPCEVIIEQSKKKLDEIFEFNKLNSHPSKQFLLSSW